MVGLSIGLAALLAGCASTATVTVTTTPSPTATGSGGGATPTATAANTPTPPPSAPPHAFAWFEYDSHNIPQIWASINGGTPKQITHVAPDGSPCDDQIAWSPPVFSPDLKHIVASLGSFNCGDGSMQGPVSIITVSNGVVSTLPSGYVILNVGHRAAGWLDNTHAWFVTYSGVFRYTLGSGVPTQLGSVSHINDAVLRGSTLFLQTDSGTTPDNWSIGRFDVNSHTLLSGVINQGQTGMCQCSPGDAHGPGWDASPDGSHAVYQKTTPSNGIPDGISSSKIYVSNADGSGAVHIAQAMTSTSTSLIQYSWDGQWIAITEAPPSPSTLTASVNTSGGSGDPNFHGYHPDSFDYPVWKWDNSQFWAATVSGDSGGPSNSAALENFHRNGASSVGVAHGFNPWYTIGG
jgi:hypothetical protein